MESIACMRLNNLDAIIAEYPIWHQMSGMYITPEKFLTFVPKWFIAFTFHWKHMYAFHPLLFYIKITLVINFLYLCMKLSHPGINGYYLVGLLPLRGKTGRPNIKFRALGWLPICFHIQFKVLVLNFKPLHDLGPSIFKCPQLLVVSLHSLTRIKTSQEHGFSVVVPVLFSGFPENMMNALTFNSFQRL